MQTIENKEYYPNGQLMYADTGKIINPNQPKYRADGTVIQY